MYDLRITMYDLEVLNKLYIVNFKSYILKNPYLPKIFLHERNEI